MAVAAVAPFLTVLFVAQVFIELTFVPFFNAPLVVLTEKWLKVFFAFKLHEEVFGRFD